MGILFSGAVVSNGLSYPSFESARVVADIAERIPRDLGTWKGRDIQLEKRIYEILETSAIIHRQYVDSDRKEVFLSVVYYPETKVDFHSPDSCLASREVQMEKSVKHLWLPSGTGTVGLSVNRLRLRRSGSEDLVYYFYKAGEFAGPNYLGLRLSLVMNRLLGVEKSGALIRLSTVIANGHVAGAAADLERFMISLYPIMLRAL